MPTQKYIPSSDSQDQPNTNNLIFNSEFPILPDVWLQLSTSARRIFLRLGVRQFGNLFYGVQDLVFVQELERQKLVEYAMTEAGGRFWRITSAGFDLLNALPEGEDARLKWIKSLYKK